MTQMKFKLSDERHQTGSESPSPTPYMLISLSWTTNIDSAVFLERSNALFAALKALRYQTHSIYLEANSGLSLPVKLR